MAKPTSNMDWATDATYVAVGEPWDGLTNKTEPSGDRAEGYEPKETLKAQYLNWHLSEVGNWLDFLEALADADDANAYNGASPHNRTLYLGPELFSVESNPWVTGQTVEISPWGGIPTSDTIAWGNTTTTTDFRSVHMGASTFWLVPINRHIPIGAVVTDVDVLVKPADTSGCTAKLWQWEGANYSTAAVGTVTNHGTDTQDGTSNLQVLSISVTEPNLRDLNMVLELQGSSGGNDVFHSIRVTYDGPRASNSGHAHSNAGSTGSHAWLTSPDPNTTTRTKATLSLNRLLPYNAAIDEIRVLVDPGAARSVSNRMRADLFSNTTRSFSTPAAGSATSVGGATDDGTTNVQVITLPSLALTLGSTSVDLVVGSGLGDSNPDRLYGIEVDFTDPGPRNF